MGDRPRDPGGTIPPGPRNNEDVPSAIDILVSALESSMDTDASTNNIIEPKLKRKLLSRVCSHCNKRKRKQGQESRQTDCKCESITILQPQSITQSQTALCSSPVDNSQVTNTANTDAARVPVGRSCYQQTDAAPYVVHVQKESNSNATTLHPVTFGRFLKYNNIKGIVNGSLKRVGRNRISLAFSSYSEANWFLGHDNLKKENYKAFIPTFNVTRMGVVKGVPNEWTEEEVLSSINVPIGCGPILKVRRIKRKVFINETTQYINTGTVIITFDGQVLPSRVYMFYTALPVELYIYPTIQCYNCCRFGHVKGQCRSVPKCYKCGQGHSGDSCDVEEDSYFCCLCKGSHQATSKKCLEYTRQKAIKETMSKSCISYMEATKMHPPVSKISYAEALLSQSPSFSVHNTGLPNISPTKPNTGSYKKTVFLKPRSPPKSPKGYDYLAHADIVRTPSLPKDKPVFNNENNKDLNIANIISVLIQLLSQSNTISPSNVAAVINALLQISNDNGSQSQSNSVELSQCHH